MSDMTSEDEQLWQRKQFAGGYVAWLDGHVILSAKTDEELCNRLDQTSVDQSRVSIEYIEPVDVVRVY
jgi:prepilin-type processing-associated H-X9-DG protein